MAMGWNDDEYDEEFDDASAYDDSDLTHDIGDSDPSKGMDPLEITDPEKAYLFLSDDVQDEIEGVGRHKMECLSCGHKFHGQIGDRCPECFSSATEILPGD